MVTCGLKNLHTDGHIEVLGKCIRATQLSLDNTKTTRGKQKSHKHNQDLQLPIFGPFGSISERGIALNI